MLELLRVKAKTDEVSATGTIIGGLTNGDFRRNSMAILQPELLQRDVCSHLLRIRVRDKRKLQLRQTFIYSPLFDGTSLFLCIC